MAEEEMSELDKLIDQTDLEYMLEFETQIFLDILHKDGLVVAAKGLNLHLVILNVLKVYCDPGNLVIVLNSSNAEEKYFKDKLKDANVHNTTWTTSTTEREDTYLSGGIHFVSTRILVVDMLKKRIPIEKIKGFVVLKAHSILESCQEAFVLRLFRQSNKTGFVKAFTNSVQSFVMGFTHVERVMRALFVKELYIWPRFHSNVIKSLKKHEPQVVELHVPISDNLRKIQTHILDLMNQTVKELKRINRTVELQEITVENCLSKKFHKVLQAQLDSIWNQLSTKSKQLFADLKTLRHLITSLMHSDPVRFYHELCGYRSKDYAQTATWVLLEAAERLFAQASALLFTGDREFNPEFCPKWQTLLEILKVEIPQEIRKSNYKESKIVILCADHKTCFQLNELLTQGPHHYLFLMALKCGISFKRLNETFKNKGKLNEEAPQPPKKLKLESATSSESETAAKEECDDFKSSYLLTMSQIPSELNDPVIEDPDASGYVFEPFKEMEELNVTQIYESLSQPTVLIQTFHGTDCISLQHSLELLKPSYIVMYHSSVTAIREIEMYEAHRRKDSPLKVYFLLHGETVEEQSYLTALRREKEAFEFLIQTKSSMVVPEDQDGKSDLCANLQRDMKSPTKNTRQGGELQAPAKRLIIVDMREFRSELPALIHKRGVDIEPVTITVGDYILTPDICVERKSLSDLIGSLNSGRLYQQCTQMSRFYSKPMLLIEFDQNKPFSWQSHFMVSTDSSNFEVQQKLLLLTLHFPKLKIIWSPSPYASAQLFEELKDGKDEPSVEYAAAIGGEQDLDVVEAKYNTSIYDFVQKLPGITSKNIDNFLRQIRSLDNVINKTEDELKEILGNSIDAKALYSALHQDHNPTEELAEPKQKVKAKFKYTKKK